MKQEEVIPTKVKPAYIPMICPVCHGHKTVNWGKEICTVCNGNGFLKVPPKEEEDYENKDNSY